MSTNANKASEGGDDRFLKVKRDPRFWEMPEKERKIKIDKRFKSMFTDKRFKLKYTVDKRGRPVNHTSSEDLKRFYNLSDTDDDEDEEDKQEDEEAGSRTKVTEEKKKEKEEKKKEEKKEEKKKKEVKEESDSVTADKCDKVTKKGAQVKVQPPPRGVRVVEEGEDEDEEDEDEHSSAEEDEAEQKDGVTGSGDEDDGSGSDDEDDDDEGSGSETEDDLARGLGNVETSSDEDDDEGEGEEEDVDAILRREEEEITHDWGELCKDALRNDQVSSRLAVCNMDWDKIKAKDLLVVFNSFKPKGGVVISVKIYPSEFGKERRELERSQGPMELMALPDDPDNDTHEQQVYRERLRDYQFKRLKYFYAVVECDSADTADHIYQNCDRSEYESSCSVLDLRFIPDDVRFEEEEPTDVATDVGVSAYTPKMFICAASGTSTVKLTWDENDHDRVTALSKDFKKEQLMDMDFNAYLASSSEEEEGQEEEEEEEEEEGGGAVESEEQEKRVQETKEEEMKPRQKKQRAEEQINKYRELLKGIQDKEKKNDKHMEMEITWTPGLRETTEQLVKQKKKMEAKEQLTPWEGYLEKKKQKKKLRKAKKKQEPTEEDLSDDDVPSDVDLNDPFFTEELGTSEVKKKKTKGKKSKKEGEERTAEEEAEVENRKAEMALLMEDEEDGERKHFNYDEIVGNQNLSKKKRKNLQKKSNQPLEEDSFQVDVKDPRFQAVFTSSLFNLDPSDPNYKKTRATQSLQAEKRRRREEGEQEEEELRKATPTTATQEAHGGGKREGPDPSLSLLVKSIKNKTQQFQARKKHKTT